MKKTLLMLLFMWLIKLSFGQSSDDLDKKMGFNKFKLETNYDQYSKDLKLAFKGLNNDKYYVYTGTDIKQVAYYPVKKIGLGFYHDSLYTISILFGDLTKQDFLKIKERLEEIFGGSNLIGASNTTTFKYELASQWEGRKVFMQLTKYSCDNNSEVGCQTELFLFSRKIKNEMDYNSF